VNEVERVEHRSHRMSAIPWPGNIYGRATLRIHADGFADADRHAVLAELQRIVAPGTMATMADVRRRIIADNPKRTWEIRQNDDEPSLTFIQCAADGPVDAGAGAVIVNGRASAR
jgi:hypothetical protein